MREGQAAPDGKQLADHLQHLPVAAQRCGTPQSGQQGSVERNGSLSLTKAH